MAATPPLSPPGHGRTVGLERALRVVAQHLHCAELAAHGAFLFVAMFAATLIHHGGIKRMALHTGPVQSLAGLAHAEFTRKGMRTTERDFASLSGDARRNNPSANILSGGQRQVLRRSKIAEEIHTGTHGQRPADGSGDMVVAGAGVDDQRPEHIQGGHRA